MTEAELIQKIIEELHGTESDHDSRYRIEMVRVISVENGDDWDSVIGPLLTLSDAVVPTPAVIVVKTANKPDGFYNCHFNIFLLTANNQLIRQHQYYCPDYDLKRKKFTWSVWRMLTEWVIDRPVAGDLKVPITPDGIRLLKALQTDYPTESISALIEMALRYRVMS